MRKHDFTPGRSGVCVFPDCGALADDFIHAAAPADHLEKGGADPPPLHGALTATEGVRVLDEAEVAALEAEGATQQ